MDLLGKARWRERGFEPRPLRALALLVAFVLVAVASGLAGTVLPLGLSCLSSGAFSLRRGVSSWGALYFRREDHPHLFAFAVGSELLTGGVLTAVGVARLFAGASVPPGPPL